jgi:hypothetical protein
MLTEEQTQLLVHNASPTSTLTPTDRMTLTMLVYSSRSWLGQQRAQARSRSMSSCALPDGHGQTGESTHTRPDDPTYSLATEATGRSSRFLRDRQDLLGDEEHLSLTLRKRR